MGTLCRLILCIEIYCIVENDGAIFYLDEVDYIQIEWLERESDARQ